ncbi:MAG: hypothetical protein MJ105_01725 [Lachnospiraceae bacterium]|nr:hypothetical protein [Lachnospiraceae bacterium]
MEYPYVLARKKTGLEFIYFAVALMGIAACVLIAGRDPRAPYFIITGMFIVIGLALGIMIVSAPKTPVVMVNPYELELPGGKVIPLAQVSFVQYKRAYARGISYRWGTITLITAQGEFTFRYVDNCEYVAQQIMGLRDQIRQGMNMQ